MGKNYYLTLHGIENSISHLIVHNAVYLPRKGELIQELGEDYKVIQVVHKFRSIDEDSNKREVLETIVIAEIF